MKISDRRLRISDSLKISDFSNSLGVLQHPQVPPAIRLCLQPPEIRVKFVYKGHRDKIKVTGAKKWEIHIPNVKLRQAVDLVL